VDFARLFHSSLVDTELLTRPSVVSEDRGESAMKYLSRWGTGNVNINTAPRHVLEAALTFGSVADAPKIADAIIRQRRVQPFADIEEAKRIVFQYSDSIEKAKDFITTTSTVYVIRVTATSGLATVRAVAAVNKAGDKVKEIGVISD
jgi:type II secretory pathway component PulK